MTKTSVWEVITALADHLHSEGATEEARYFYEESVALAVVTFGGGHLLVGYSLLLLEEFLEGICELESARKIREIAISIYLRNSASELLFTTRKALRDSSIVSMQSARKRLRERTMEMTVRNLANSDQACS
ncbi:MAG: hypothetical protein K2X77_15205 [Candidatus Obscuribacterales bacterium]|jgi:hypothetical protein|nr:hypothetical protein [Candidatus Obscuribacterales bacterium]